MKGWINSPGHRRNLLYRDVTHFGAGIALESGDRRFYATQKFMSYSAIVNADDWERRNSGDLRSIRFKINKAKVDPEDLVVKVNFPDSQARWYTPSGSYYTGSGYPEPEWLSDTEFVVTLPVDEYGTGNYGIQLGISGGTTTFSNQLVFHTR